jgi:hypothetical protein
MVKDFKIIFLIHCDIRWYKFFMSYPARIKKKLWPLSWFFHLFMQVSSVMGAVVCAIPLFASWFQGRIQKRKLLSPVMIWLWKSGSVSSCSSISANASFQYTFWSPFKFFGTMFAHNFLSFKSCVTILWSVHWLILSSQAIVRIVKCRSWRMKALTQPMFVPVLTEARRTDRSSSSTISCPFQNSLSHRNTWARNTDAFSIFL